MAQSFKLSKQAKLTKADDFSSVFNFRKRITSTHLVIHYQPNLHQRPRIGLVVSKKAAKLAVSRNYIRRVLRELFRLKQHEIAHVDLILRVQKKFTKSDFIEVTKEFDMLISKLNQKAKATFSSTEVAHLHQGEIQ